ncbi:LuxR C-terminal-related transcriptional regulator [Streptomyces sp. MS2A]|uniref:response regulator transcription factor n=1 Tax=Streptomyces sp. enrichment culture TaxID=1795815 RepID=UPI0022F00FFA|nr:LuxR C-terminal-related transcriptional regulator [Streptomyces sp. MS2A]
MPTRHITAVHHIGVLLTARPETCVDLSTVTDDDQKILHLLYAGFSDASIARRLGMGHRTVQRRIQRLMERLRANGRVALGARAQELGLLRTPRPPYEPGGRPPYEPGGRPLRRTPSRNP